MPGYVHLAGKIQISVFSSYDTWILSKGLLMKFKPKLKRKPVAIIAEVFVLVAIVVVRDFLFIPDQSSLTLRSK
jgi:hypothetical protein